MIVFPNCKLNIGLNVLGKRDDGYHDIETVFVPLGLSDILEAIVSPPPRSLSLSESSSNSELLRFSVTGTQLPGDPSENLCLKAYQILETDFPNIHPIQIHLHKIIPTGAGLGGGSSDASFTLQILNKLFSLNLTKELLVKYATQLGSDCPFFIINKPCYATGRGEIMEEIKLPLSDYTFTLVNPGIQISTATAFSSISPATPSTSLRELIAAPITTWKDKISNQFESIAFKQYPEMENIKAKLYDAGAVYAAMTGSGSTIYGIFSRNEQQSISFPSHYFVKRSISQL